MARGLTRVALVEGHLLFAEALDLALTAEGLRVHRMRPNRHGDLQTNVVQARPTVALLHLESSDDARLLVTPIARAGIPVVAVTTNREGARWGEYLRYGARTVLPTTTALSRIAWTLRQVGAGREVMPPDERQRLVAEFLGEEVALEGMRQRLGQLTAREAEVLSHLREGVAVCEIARDSCVSEATVRTQVRNILTKLEVNSQLAAVGIAHRVKWDPRSTVLAFD